MNECIPACQGRARSIYIGPVDPGYSELTGRILGHPSERPENRLALEGKVPYTHQFSDQDKQGTDLTCQNPPLLLACTYKLAHNNVCGRSPPWLADAAGGMAQL